MAATAKVTVDTTGGGTTLVTARPDRVTLTLYNEGAVEVMVKPVIANETLSANLYRLKLPALTGFVEFTGADARLAYRGLTASSNAVVMVGQTFTTDTGV